MKKVRITVVRKACYPDLMEKYENPIEHACDIDEGAMFIANGWQRPEGLCESAWETMSPFVMGLARGAENFYDGWMKNPRSAMISCNDGFMMVMGMMTYSGGSACGKPVIHLGPVGMSPDIESFKDLFVTYGQRMGEQLLKIQ